jgi:hypothetical protein
MHLARAAIYGVRGRAVKPANAPDDGLGEAIECRVDAGPGWIASSQVLLAMTDDAALPIARLIQLLPPLDAHCYAHRHFAPEPYHGVFFLRNIFRFCAATAGSTASAPSRNCRQEVRFCRMPFIVAAALPRVCRMPAASPQEFPRRG